MWQVWSRETNKPQPIFCVSTKLWLHPDLLIWASFLWTQRVLKIPSLGTIWNRAPMKCHQTVEHRGHCLKSRCIGTGRVRAQLLTTATSTSSKQLNLSRIFCFVRYVPLFHFKITGFFYVSRKYVF